MPLFGRKDEAGRGGSSADVVVVGAGIAGLVAARELVKAGKSVLVIEANDRVGGRAYAEEIGDGTLDLGGQWIGAAHTKIRRLAGELGLEIFPTYVDGKKYLDIDGSVSIYKGKIPRISPLSLIDIQRAMWKLQRLEKKVPCDRPNLAKHAAKWDGMTLESFVRKQFFTGKARKALDPGIRTVFGCETSELSMLFLLFYCNSSGGLETLFEAEGGAQQDRIDGGMQMIPKLIAKDLGERVVLNSPAVAVEQLDNGVSVKTKENNYRADRAILAIPPPVTSRIEFTPQLPSWRRQLAQKMAMGAAIKFNLTYDSPFWRERGFTGEIVSNEGPVSITYDNTTNDGKQAALVGFIVGKHAYEWSGRNEGERCDAVLSHLARYLGPEVRSIEDYVDKDWSEEAWIGGAPTGYTPPGALSLVKEQIGAPTGRIHWAGTETATKFSGYLEGALLTGERAAGEVVAALESDQPESR